MLITDNTIAFAKEIFANLESVMRENYDIENRLLYYERMLQQFSATRENLSDEFCKKVYVSIKPDGDVQEPELLDDAITMLSQKIDYLRESFEYGKKEQEELTSLFNHLTKVYPDLVDNLKLR